MKIDLGNVLMMRNWTIGYGKYEYYKILRHYRLGIRNNRGQVTNYVTLYWITLNSITKETILVYHVTYNRWLGPTFVFEMIIWYSYRYMQIVLLRNVQITISQYKIYSII